MAVTVRLFSADTNVPLTFQFVQDDGTPKTVTGDTVTFRYRLRGTSAVTSVPAVVLDGGQGTVQVTLGPLAAGVYEGQFRDTQVGGLVVHSDVITLLVGETL